MATAAQMAGLKKARAALKAKYGTSNIAEIAKRKGTKRRKSNPVASKPVGLEANPTKRKRSKKRKGHRAAGKHSMSRKQKKALKKAQRASARARHARAAGHTARPRKARKHKRGGKGGGTHRSHSRASSRSRSHTARSHSRSKSHSRSRDKSRHHTRSHTTRHSRSVERVKVVKVPSGTMVQPVGRRGGKRRRRSNPVTAISRYENPMPMIEATPAAGGLLSNAGPFTTESLKGYAIAAGGVGLGFVIADFLDRYVATRAPANGKYPWYGRDAAAAQRRRPDAWRLGAQAILAVGAMAGTYFSRNGRVLPWLLGGTAVGAGAKLLESLVNWWLMPALLSVKDPAEISFANRMYPMEQSALQDQIDKLFDQWTNVASLNAAQVDPPAIKSPLADNTAQDIYTLGRGTSEGKAHSPAANRPQGVGSPANTRGEFIRTGRLGMCDSCGGMGGCWSGSCSDYNCASCQKGPDGSTDCMYTVKPTDILGDIVAASGADSSVIDQMNGGSSEVYWQAGNRVMLPFVVCRYLSNRVAQNAIAVSMPAGPLPDLPVGDAIAMSTPGATYAASPTFAVGAGQPGQPAARAAGGGVLIPDNEEAHDDAQ